MIPERPLLEVNALKKHFPIHGGLLGQVTANVYAVDGVTFDIRRGETLSLVGESGCGKSTVGKAILRLFKLTDGEVYLNGERIDDMRAGKLRMMRKRVQVVFQDPFSSLNPRMKVRDILAEPLINFGMARGRKDVNEQVGALMDKVRLPRDAINRFPHEFSGGQRQRIGIARALATCQARSIHRRGAGSTPAARSSSTAAAPRNPCCVLSVTATCQHAIWMKFQ